MQVSAWSLPERTQTTGELTERLYVKPTTFLLLATALKSTTKHTLLCTTVSEFLDKMHILSKKHRCFTFKALLGKNDSIFGLGRPSKACIQMQILQSYCYFTECVLNCSGKFWVKTKDVRNTTLCFCFFFFFPPLLCSSEMKQVFS